MLRWLEIFEISSVDQTAAQYCDASSPTPHEKVRCSRYHERDPRDWALACGYSRSRPKIDNKDRDVHERDDMTTSDVMCVYVMMAHRADFC